MTKNGVKHNQVGVTDLRGQLEQLQALLTVPSLTKAVPVEVPHHYETYTGHRHRVTGKRFQLVTPATLSQMTMEQPSTVEQPKAEQPQAVAPIFYSKQMQVLSDKMPKRAQPGQVRGIVQSAGVTKEEQTWSRLHDYLTAHEERKVPVSKDDLLQHLQGHHIHLGEILKTEADGDTKYHQYTVPGGGHYQELLFTLPESRGGPYQSGHWDEGNVLSHVRFNERLDAEGNKVLFLEEVQSDWHQAGRSKGYRSLDGYEGLAPGYSIEERAGSSYTNNFALLDSSGKQVGLHPTAEAAEYAADAHYADTVPPEAPFKGEGWKRYCLKRMLRWAAEHDCAKLAWTTGAQQADRYDLSKHIDQITWEKHPDGMISFSAYKGPDTIHTETHIPEEKVEEFLGKELAAKIMDSGKPTGLFRGLDLKVGGAGMRAFYDTELVNIANNIVKKWVGRVGTTEIPTTNPVSYLEFPDGINVYDADGNVVDEAKTVAEAQSLIAAGKGDTVHSIELTPQMKHALLYEGQPLFKSLSVLLEDGSQVQCAYGFPHQWLNISVSSI